MKLNYPKHKHPHGVENVPENPQRIWVCEECQHTFTDTEIRRNAELGVCGHECEDGYLCESHLESYLPEVKK